MNFAIIIVAYNRPFETQRLINSIFNADFMGDIVDLIIDIDKGEKQGEISDIANSFFWPYGNLIVKAREQKMGLKSHVFDCFAYVDSYDAIIVLEDDLVVSPSFYLFAKQACDYYRNDERISEISLYSYFVNEFESRPFVPAKVEYDAYLMQVVQSWGECLTRSMWQRFKQSKSFSMENIDNVKLHRLVNSWKSNSWKKVFFNYLIETNSFVVYPYFSFTTNYTVSGEHSQREVPDYHVQMEEGKKHDYLFGKYESCIKYDSFFERIFQNNSNLDDACVDLYGSKTFYENKKLLLSTRLLPFSVVKQYGMTRKPQENNVIFEEKGRSIFLYDLTKKGKKPRSNDSSLLRNDFGFLSWRRAIKFGFSELLASIKRKLKR